MDVLNVLALRTVNSVNEDDGLLFGIAPRVRGPAAHAPRHALPLLTRVGTDRYRCHNDQQAWLKRRAR